MTGSPKDRYQIPLSQRIQKALGNRPKNLTLRPDNQGRVRDFARKVFHLIEAKPDDLVEFTLRSVWPSSAIGVIFSISARIEAHYEKDIARTLEELREVERLKLGAWLLDRVLECGVYTIYWNKKIHSWMVTTEDTEVSKLYPKSYTSFEPFKPWENYYDEHGHRLVNSPRYRSPEYKFSRGHSYIPLSELMFDWSDICAHVADEPVYKDDPETGQELAAEMKRHSLKLTSWESMNPPEVYVRAVNKLESVGFRVNKELLDIIIQVDKRKRFHDGQDESSIGRRKDFDRIIKEAERLKGHDFYHRAFLDYRGRIYLTRSDLNYQGPDEARALVEFAEGEVIRDSEDIDEILIHAANMFGAPGTRTNRLDWAKKNLSKMKKFAKDPIKHNEWVDEADEPLCFLRACLEVRDAKVGYVTHLPVELDASNSGYQHIAMMTNDLKLGSLCNVVPPEVDPSNPNVQQITIGEKIGDLYGTIAKKLKDELSPDLANSPDLRKAVKAVAVPYAYGAKHTGIKESIRKRDKVRLLREMKDDELKDFIRKTVRVLGIEVPVIKDVESFLKNAVQDAFDEGQECFEWETLTGFRVVMSPRLKWLKKKRQPGKSPMKKHPVYLRFKEEPIQPVAYDYNSGDVDIGELRQQIAPNLVHSQDAALVHLVLALWENTPIVTVHDAFAVTAPHVLELQNSVWITMAFLSLRNPLKNFAAQAIGDHTLTLPIKKELSKSSWPRSLFVCAHIIS